ncbi:hypothetical protein CXB51_023762 [Gossypium anomalum]|uniref:Cyclin n=1 Tax=Gossypium anomalum TaxID=47600 RepID=A0A8J5YM54_9ROSI|nr:hypothetical protein CXB51_023762 [Gossypium anomalum]
MAEADDDQQTVPKVITYLSSLLQRVAKSNDKRRLFQSQKMSVFHGLTRPTISITTYLHRIFKHANCSPCCFVVAYVYLDRFMQMHPYLPLNSFNVHRLLITSVLVSAKFMDDICYNNAYYAKVGGISSEEMNILEVDFLFGLGFQLNNLIKTLIMGDLSRSTAVSTKMNPAISSNLLFKLIFYHWWWITGNT